MSFDPLRFLDDPPPFVNENAQVQEHYRQVVDTLRRFISKQRQTGIGIQYDTQDRVEVPIWYLWMYT